MRKRFAIAVFVLLSCGLTLAVHGAVGKSEPAGFATGLVAHQQGSPLAILGTTSDVTLMYREVRVQNTSGRVIQTIRFGVMELPVGLTNVRPNLRTLDTVSVVILPGATATLQTAGIPHTEIADILGRFGGTSVSGQLGILSVKFADGAAWTYEAGSNGGFRGVSTNAFPRHTVACSPTTDSHNAGIVRASLLRVKAAFDPHFTCVSAAESCIYCSNLLTSCSVNICGTGTGCTPATCPQQTCMFVP